jgi:hypothetical protein
LSSGSSFGSGRKETANISTNMALVALCMFLTLSSAVASSFAADVSMVNYLDEPVVFQDCHSSHEGTIQGQPEKGAVLQPGESATFVVNASHVLEALSGQCWWDTNSHFDCFKNGTGPNGTTPKPPNPSVTSCPYISWKRGVDIKTKSFGGSWDFDAPYETVDTHWEAPGVTHKRYCACKKGLSRIACDQKCKSPPPTPSPPPSPQPPTHYTNPKTGCAYDEKSMVSDDKSGASICSPKCTPSGGILPHETCAKDVPSGVTAVPHCNFIDWDTDIKYCALNCRADAKYKLLCAAGATCFEEVVPDPLNPNATMVQGFCGYNQTAAGTY